MNKIPYVYKWIHLPSLRWYVGSRTAEGCNPNDGYICSSRHVKPLILNRPWEWKREIIATGSVSEMRELETEILNIFQAKFDSRSLNRTNGQKEFYPPKGIKKSLATVEKMKAYHATLEAKMSKSKRFKGKPKSPEHNLKNSIANKGKKRSLEARIKNGLAKKGVFVGEKNHKAKLTAQEVIEIRTLYDNSNITIKALTKMFNKVNESTMHNIVTRKNWKHIP